MLLAAPSAAPGVTGGPLAGPANLRVAAITPHGVTLAWDAAVNSGSFTYVIESSFGYRVGVPQTQTTYTWTRAMVVPGRTYSFVMWAGNAKGHESAKSNTVTVTLPVDTTPPAAPGNLYAVDVDGCETWLFWNESVDDVDPQYAILYEVDVNGVFDGAQTDVDRWITYGTQSSNTFSVQAVDSAGNRAPISIVTLDNQTC